jgi:hypothetical protein
MVIGRSYESGRSAPGLRGPSPHTYNEIAARIVNRDAQRARGGRRPPELCPRRVGSAGGDKPTSDSHARAALSRPKAALDRLELYERPVRIERARIVCAAWLLGKGYGQHGRRPRAARARPIQPRTRGGRCACFDFPCEGCTPSQRRALPYRSATQAGPTTGAGELLLIANFGTLRHVRWSFVIETVTPPASDALSGRSGPRIADRSWTGDLAMGSSWLQTTSGGLAAPVAWM